MQHTCNKTCAGRQRPGRSLAEAVSADCVELDAHAELAQQCPDGCEGRVAVLAERLVETLAADVDFAG